MEGEPTISRHPASPRRLIATTAPQQGDLLTTGQADRVSLALLPNLLVQLEGATELEIAALSLAKDGNETGDAMLERNAHVRLRRGELVISQERTDVSAVPDLVVETGAGKLLSRFDCLVRIETGVGATRLLCVSGTAAFEPRGGGSVPLTPGEFMEWREGKRPTTTTADATPAGQRIITNALEEATRLQTLRDGLRDVLPK